MRANGVIPLAIPNIRFKLDVGKLLFRNAPTGGIEPFIQAAINLESSAGGGSGNEFNNDLMGDKWLAPPILGDKRKEAMLNLVPLASAWGEMANGNRELKFIGEFLQFDFPEANAIAITAAAIGNDEQRGGVGIERLPEFVLPGANRRSGKFCGIMTEPNTHPSFILG